MSILRRPRLLCRGILLGLACAAIAWLISRQAPVRGFEEWLLDDCFQMRFHLRGRRPTAAHVVLVGLDEASLDELGKPAAYISGELAEVVAYARRQGAAAIGLDVIVPESLTETLPKEESRAAVRLGKAIEQAGNVVLPEWMVEGAWLRPLAQWQTTDTYGFVGLSADPDHFLRRQMLIGQSQQRLRLHFALQLYARANHLEPIWDGRQLWLGEQIVPVDEAGRLRVNFVGPPHSFRVVPLREVLAAAREDKPLGTSLAGAIVIIGSTAASSQDIHATPYANGYFRLLSNSNDGLMTGPEFHANLIATLADHAYIREPAWLAPLLLVLVGPLLGVVFAALNLEVGFLLAVAHHFAWKGLCLAAFAWANLRVEGVPMLVLGFVAYAATFALRWRRLRGMLGVVQSEAVARVLESGETQDWRGQERELTVLFADVRDFTSFAQSRPARDVVALLNAYFSMVAPIIEAHGGTLNKYLGDGVLAFFGAPAACPEHARQAVRTAVAMVRQVHAERATWAGLGQPAFRIGVGIHTGKVVAGTVGSRRRLEYTVIGDTVNAAARIEAQNRVRGTEILISAATYAALPAADRLALGCEAEPWLVQVKGIEDKLALHAVPVG